ncbi:cryptochrome/photolyase family protein [Pseudanabaena mucicola]|uniref:Cryptochrome/photolyase family protein n=1 Tax=Pseudanabaena mucicola FACHB-723 TaxID=2692860 RepID=A0ABR7ZZE3_9CYAN|nr:cryptochrome/photolyase family protein [Pseudanabaena mucicola]MBD2189164.1 cryptochrome/photolyase family protein [Pseudanabaena mucicola FACHB-723]
MLETARKFLSQIDNYPITASLENKLANCDRSLFILHDQLNLSVFPKQLLDQKPLLIFVESLKYATAIPHHKQKLVYILSAQRHFAIACYQQGFPILNLFTEGFHAEALAEFLQQYPAIKLSYMQPSEWDTRSQMAALADTFCDRIEQIPNNFFIADADQFKDKIKKGYRLENFYRELRKQTGYLMADGKPIGGNWNYDKENRKALPKNISIPPIPEIPPDLITQEVIDLVNNYLPHNFGKLDRFSYAVTRDQALELAKVFIETRLANFGAYEDATKTGEPFLFHSVLSIYLNNGLLLPQEICEIAIAAYHQNLAPLNSVEGFVRQILGWREYIRVYYEAQMPQAREHNYFGFTNDLPQLYWDADTDLLCMQDAVTNVLNYGYSHHIQRLMVLSNFSNLTNTDPRQLNRWFWLAYIDAYEWVELPNVLGMSTFADGGILASKPYVAGGNYINKMSNCCSQCQYDVKEKVGDKACPFNYLYWHFVDQHRESFAENGRVSLMVNSYNKKTEVEKQAIRDSATKFISQLKIKA